MLLFCLKPPCVGEVAKLSVLPEGLSDFQKAEKDNPSVSLPLPAPFTKGPYSHDPIHDLQRQDLPPVAGDLRAGERAGFVPPERCALAVRAVKAAEDEAQYSIVPCVSAASMRCGAPQGESVSLRPASSERITPSNATAVSPSLARTVMPETVSRRGECDVRFAARTRDVRAERGGAVLPVRGDLRVERYPPAVSTVSANAFQFSVSRRAPQPVSSRGYHQCEQNRPLHDLYSVISLKIYGSSSMMSEGVMPYSPSFARTRRPPRRGRRTR